MKQNLVITAFVVLLSFILLSIIQRHEDQLCEGVCLTWQEAAYVNLNRFETASGICLTNGE